MSETFTAVLRVRAAVRDFIAEHAPDAGTLGVAVSGGADSLALTDAAAAACRDSRVRVSAVHAVVVDHGLQPESDRVARDAADAAKALGATSANVVPVEVTGGGGPEAAARRARYAALVAAMPGEIVLLGHTLDDQAETVLLGLGRGSGPRSVAGMAALDPPWGRPLLGVPRAVTVQACAELGVQPWQDPHNSDARFTRVRLRTEVLPLLESVLQGGVGGALARTAAQLREDLEALDALADELLVAASGRASSATGELSVAVLARAPAALRRRAIRTWLLAAGAPELTDNHLRAVDALVAKWHGQGGAWVPGGLVVSRTRGKLALSREGSARPGVDRTVED